MRYADLDKMHVLKWSVTPFDTKKNNKGYESDLDEFIQMHMDFKAKALFKSKNLTEYWSNINTATKYPKLRSAAEPFFHFHCMQY